MEGISTIVDWAEVNRNDSEYNHTRKIMAKDLNSAIEGALESGAKEIAVCDAHGGARNLRLEQVHEAAYLIRGSPKPNSMMEGIDEGFDAAMYVGYHSMKGTPNGICAHTISGSTVNAVYVNGRETGEFGLNSSLAGFYGVSSMFLAGGYAATVEAEKFVPGITTAAVKWAVGRNSAKCLHPEKAARLIRARVKDAFSKKYPSPPFIDSPVEVKVVFANSVMADVASMIPELERIDGITLRGVYDDYQTALSALRAGIYMAGGTTRR
jgi:D-amino peptidase